MKHQANRRNAVLVGLAVLIGVATLCLVLPLVLTDGGTMLWILLVGGVVVTAVLASRAVWDVLDDGSHPRR